MGSEQSHHSNNFPTEGRSVSGASRIQRGHTIAVAEINQTTFDDGGNYSADSRPVSPPISVCSDSDLPYISYTDRPIGDSPKIRNKGQIVSRNFRANSISSVSSRKQPIPRAKQRPNTAHTIVVVKSATKDPGPEKDPDILRLQNIPMFLPVMRGTLSSHSHRDPEVLDRLPSIHLQNICSRMQAHYNMCATQVAADQNQIMAKIKDLDQFITKLFAAYVEKQKAYASYAEQFSKIRSISQQLSRCNTLLNQNLESLETLNNYLDVEDRLEPFFWKTE